MTAAEMQRAFPMPEPIDRAAKRLRCTGCGHRGASVVAVPAPGR